MSTVDPFETIVFDRDALGVAIMNRSHVFADDPSYTPASFRIRGIQTMDNVATWISG